MTPESTEPPADWRIMRRAVMDMNDVRTLCAWVRERMEEDEAAYPDVPGDPPAVVIALWNIEDALAAAVETKEDTTYAQNLSAVSDEALLRAFDNTCGRLWPSVLSGRGDQPELWQKYDALRTEILIRMGPLIGDGGPA